MTDRNVELYNLVITKSKEFNLGLQDAVETVLSEKYPNINTRWNSYYQLKKHIENNPFLHLSESPPDEWRVERDIFNTKKQDAREIIELKLEDFETILNGNVIAGLTIRDSMYNMGLKLLAKSGRRLDELFNSEFEERDGDIYATLSKRKTNEMCKVVLINTTPTEFMANLEEFRAWLDMGRDGKAVLKKTFNMLGNRYLKSNLGSEWTIHKIRSAYAMFLADKSNLVQGQRTKFIQKVLCHVNPGSSVRYNYASLV